MEILELRDSVSSEENSKSSSSSSSDSSQSSSSSSSLSNEDIKPSSECTKERTRSTEENGRGFESSGCVNSPSESSSIENRKRKRQPEALETGDCAKGEGKESHATGGPPETICVSTGVHSSSDMSSLHNSSPYFGRKQGSVPASPKNRSNKESEDGTSPAKGGHLGGCCVSDEDQCHPEIDPYLYMPPEFQPRPKPMVHSFSIHNRPVASRRTLAVKQLFPHPADMVWKDKFDTFNHLQSEVANTLVHSSDNLLVSAPTGAGKTALFEMAMARHLLAELNHSRNQGAKRNLISKGRKIVYIAPSKALCDERHEDWTQRLGHMGVGVQCAMITGDADASECYRDLVSAHIILTTPEKWDSLTRRWNENFFLFASVKLLLLDEIHLLGDPSRGHCLESIVCRMRTVARATTSKAFSEAEIRSSSYPDMTPAAFASSLRIVAVSATLPNVEDIAEFLGAHETYVFDSSYRPVPLTTHVLGLGYVGKNQFMFSKGLSRHIPELIRRFSNNKSAIVFCHTKKETEQMALELSTARGIGVGNNMELASKTKVTALQKGLLRGVAYHHAGLDSEERKLVERAFIDGTIRCLCATSTLAMGVNLPAHLVIIKGTSTWRGSGLGNQEIDKGTLLQMMGRAGRPGFDSSGTAIIMTDNASKRKYEQLSIGLEVVESQLGSKLVQILNTEISQRVITNFQTAVNWLKDTFFFIRCRTNPSNYGLLCSSNDDLQNQLVRICGESLKALDAEGIIHVDRDDGSVMPLFASHVMCQHMVEFEAMKKIAKLPHDATAVDILKSLSEFVGLHRPVRRSEKKLLNDAHRVVKFKLQGPPSKVRIQQPSEKAFVLLQCAIGQHYLEDFTLRQEMSMMVEYATRMLSAAEEFSTRGSRHGNVALQCLRLRRAFSASLWGSSDGVLNQLPGVGAQTTARLRFSKIVSFEDVLNSTDEAIERAAARAPPFGRELRLAVGSIMNGALCLSASLQTKEDTSSKSLVCTLSRRPGSVADPTKDTKVVKYSIVCFTDRPGGVVCFQSQINSEGQYHFRVEPPFETLHIHLVSNFVGLDEQLVLDCIGQSVQSNGEPRAFPFTPTKVSASKKFKKEKAHVNTYTKKQSPKLSQLWKDVPQAPKTTKRFPSNSRIERRSPPKTTTRASVALERTTKQQHVSQSDSTPMMIGDESSVGKAATAVTPSPPPPRGNTKISRSLCVSKADSATEMHHHPWRKQRRDQRSLQQSAFRTEKENPFSRFNYDPNDAESNLDAVASDGNKSVLPPHAFARLDQNNENQLPWSRDFSNGPQRIHSRRTLTPSTSGRRVRRRRRRRYQSPRIPAHEILHQKMEEHEAYTSSYFSSPKPFVNSQLAANNHEAGVHRTHRPLHHLEPEFPFDGELDKQDSSTPGAECRAYPPFARTMQSFADEPTQAHAFPSHYNEEAEFSQVLQPQEYLPPSIHYLEHRQTQHGDITEHGYPESRMAQFHPVHETTYKYELVQPPAREFEKASMDVAVSDTLSPQVLEENDVDFEDQLIDEAFM